MNCIFWFGNKFASYKQYKDLCRRAGEPIVLSYCSVEGQDRRASLERLGRMLDSTPDRLLGVVVDGQLDLMERVMGVVDGRAPVLFRKTNNPFRGGDAFDGGRGSFGCSWFQCAGFELDSEPLRAADSAAEFLWLSDNEMPAEAERQLRKCFPEVTVRCCSPGSASVLGLAYDTECKVTPVMDQEVYEAEQFACHPCRNDGSLRLKTSDLLTKFFPHIGHAVTVVDLPGSES